MTYYSSVSGIIPYRPPNGAHENPWVESLELAYVGMSRSFLYMLT